ncbi:vegetative cell wall protein gp1 [Sitophilus oryzae]|uniref:Vegetative cell wall protein gp1 n=1 Tax=Sitophilus oryzae TaxID=7048 RepID=A0A6J2XU12_SITOR|nr:vegetative cell wall protein gp1 [Sitophilus oryzae]
MRNFVVLATLLVAAWAHPQGYNYPSAPSGPSDSYGAPPSSNYGPPAPPTEYGAPAPGIVQKHVYVHVPPPEKEQPKPRKPIEVAPAQKHYKIIFIKAPTPPTPTAPVIPVQPQNEEKTLVYVLVKKPEEAPEITIPTPAPTQPSKPEVYFIRYKTQKEAEGPYPASGQPAGPPSSKYGPPSGNGNGNGGGPY